MSVLRALLSFASIVMVAGVAACGGSTHSDAGVSTDAGVVAINTRPTGSITTPSLCERTQLDTRVLTPFVEGFAFLWATDHYLVVYADSTTNDIYSVTVSSTGAALRAAEVVEQTPGFSSLPTLAATTSGYVVAWQEGGTPTTVQVHTLDVDGHPTGGSHQIATTPSIQMRPTLAPSPMGTAISWMDQAPTSNSDATDVGTSTTWLGLLDDNDDLRTDIPAVQITPANQSGYPWLAGDTQTLSLLLSDNVAGRTDVYYSAVSATLGTSLLDVRDPGATMAALLGRLEKTDFGSIATWEDHRSGEAEVYMSLLDSTGARYGGGLVEEPMTGNANWPHQAWTGTAAGIVYYQFRAGKPQVFMTFIDATGNRIGGAADMQVSDTTAQAKFPDVQWNGSTFGVLWLDTRDSSVGAETLYFNSATCEAPAPI